MDLADRVAIVTGAAGGIGSALAEGLLRKGARVVITDRDGDRLAETERRFVDVHGDAVVSCVGDAAATTDISRSIELARREFGPVDLYAANAGVGDGSGLDATDEDWSVALEVNVMAHVRAARLLVPEWLERGEGYFISTASAAGLLTQVGSATYSVSKHGAVGFAEWLAVTYGHRGIHVSCLCPMGVDTDMLRGGMGADEGGRRAAAAVTSSGDVLGPAQVADDVLEAVVEERFLILPHPEVAEFARRKISDHDRWIRGMQRHADRSA